jgi:hypothetical protein
MKLIYSLLIFSISHCSLIHNTVCGSEAQRERLDSFAACLIKFVEPIKDESLPSLAFIIQNDLEFYSNYRTILDVEIYDSRFSSVKTPKVNCESQKRTMITIKKALILYGIAGIFNIFGEDPVIKEIFSAMEIKCIEDSNVIQKKLATLGKAKSGDKIYKHESRCRSNQSKL